MSGPIKEESGRVRHYKGVGEQVQQETSLGKSARFNFVLIEIFSHSVNRARKQEKLF